MLEATGGGVEERPLREARVPARTPASLLVVEDDEATACLLERILDREGYRVTVVRDSTAARAEIDAGHHDLVITDLWLNGELSGAGFAAEVRERLSGRIPVLVLTGASLDETAHLTAAATGILVLHKPFHIDDLAATVCRLLAP